MKLETDGTGPGAGTSGTKDGAGASSSTSARASTRSARPGPRAMSPSSIISLIGAGKAIVIFQNSVLNLTPWLAYHPGGDKAVLHMVGRDATDEMIAYHGEGTVELFKRWKIGEIDYEWRNLLPPIQGGIYSTSAEGAGAIDGASSSAIASAEGASGANGPGSSTVGASSSGASSSASSTTGRLDEKMDWDSDLSPSTSTSEASAGASAGAIASAIASAEGASGANGPGSTASGANSSASGANSRASGANSSATRTSGGANSNANSSTTGPPRSARGPTRPIVPQNLLVTPANTPQIFPHHTIINPQHVIENYDNSLARADLLAFPDLDYPTQNDIRAQYNALHATIIRLGLYQCHYGDYVREMIKILSIFLVSVSFYKLGYVMVSAVVLGLAWQQGTFIAHDAGHISISHNYIIDNVFGMLVADFLGGLSLGWWKKNHNVHHLITNDPVHDPDIQHLPFFAVSTRLFGSVYSTYYEKWLYFDAVAKRMVQFQNYLYYPILCFGRFNLYRLSWGHVLTGGGPRKGQAAWFRYFEFVGLSFFTYWYFYLMVYKYLDGTGQRLGFLMLSNVASFIVHVQITLSHFAMSTSDLGVSESFAMRQIRTTMDVDCPQWLDFFHGGLQFQAVHHLFPRLPRHNLRAAQPYVVEFCRRTGMKYSIYGFGEGNEVVISKLRDVGKQCGIMLEAARAMDGSDAMNLD